MPGSFWCGCWHRSSMRWLGATPPDDLPRGVSRKARRHIVKIRMPGSPQPQQQHQSSATPQAAAVRETKTTRKTKKSKLPGNIGKKLSTATQSVKRVSAQPNGETVEGDINGPASQEDKEEAGEAPAVAVKVRRHGLFGLFRRPSQGGEDDVVMVQSGQTCVICLETFKAGEVLQVLLCRHLYHDRLKAALSSTHSSVEGRNRCIDRWLGEHTSCCVCKADLEEMARAIGKPSRRPSGTRSDLGGVRPRLDTADSRASDIRSETRSESGYTSDQARSNFSTVSAPAAVVDWMPPDNGRLGGYPGRSLSNGVSVLQNIQENSSRRQLRWPNISIAMKEMEREGRTRSPMVAGGRSPQLGASSNLRAAALPPFPPTWNLDSSSSSSSSSSASDSSNVSVSSSSGSGNEGANGGRNTTQDDLRRASGRAVASSSVIAVDGGRREGGQGHRNRHERSRPSSLANASEGRHHGTTPEDRYNSHFFHRRASPRCPTRLVTSQSPSSHRSPRPSRNSPRNTTATTDTTDNEDGQNDQMQTPGTPQRPVLSSAPVSPSLHTVSALTTPQRSRRLVNNKNKVPSTTNGTRDSAFSTLFTANSSILATPSRSRSTAPSTPTGTGRSLGSGAHAAASSAWGWQSSPRATTVSGLSPRPCAIGGQQRPPLLSDLLQRRQETNREIPRPLADEKMVTRRPEQQSPTRAHGSGRLEATFGSTSGAEKKPDAKDDWDKSERSSAKKPWLCVQVSSSSDDNGDEEDDASPAGLANAGSLGRRLDAPWKGSLRDERWLDACDEKSPSSSHRSDAVTCSTQISEMESQFSGGSALSGASGGGEDGASASSDRHAVRQASTYAAPGTHPSTPPCERKRSASIPTSTVANCGVTVDVATSPCTSTHSAQHLWGTPSPKRKSARRRASMTTGSPASRRAARIAGLRARSMSAPIIWDEEPH